VGTVLKNPFYINRTKINTLKYFFQERSVWKSILNKHICVAKMRSNGEWGVPTYIINKYMYYVSCIYYIKENAGVIKKKWIYPPAAA